MISEARVIKILRALLGAIFILSSVAKIYSLKFFDELVAKQLIGDDYFEHLDLFYWVQWLTRILISGEFMLGVAILQQRYLKKIVLPFMIGLLVVFTLQIFYEAEIHDKGYIGGNCGCFGEVIPLDNLQTIIKNIVMIAMTLVVFRQYKDRKEMNLPPVIIPFIVGIVTLFTLSRTFNKIEPVQAVDMSQFESTPQITETHDSALTSAIDTSKKSTDTLVASPSVQKKDTVVKAKKISLFERYRNFSGGVYKDLDKGTHMICLFSFSCSHCQQAYRDILELRKKGGKTGEVYVIGYGSEFDEKSFWSMTGAKSPFIRTEDFAEFTKIRKGDDFPKIIVMKDSKAVASWNYSSYSRETLFKQFGINSTPDVKIPGANGIELDNKKSGGSLFIENKPNKSLFE